RTERDRFPDFPWRTLPSWGVLPESQRLTPTLSDRRTCRRSSGLGRWCRRDDATVSLPMRDESLDYGGYEQLTELQTGPLRCFYLQPCVPGSRIGGRSGHSNG